MSKEVTIAEELRKVREALEPARAVLLSAPSNGRYDTIYAEYFEAISTLNRLIPEIEEMESDQQHAKDFLKAGIAVLDNALMEAAPLETSGGEPASDSSGLRQGAINAAHRAFDNAFCSGETTYRAVEEAIINYEAYRTPQPDPLAFLDSAETVEALAEAIHEGTMKEAWGSWDSVHRKPWTKPNAASPKQPWHDMAYAQAKAALSTIKRLAKEGGKE